MNVLTGKNILIGISGSIAAYKIPDMIRKLRKNGAEVCVIMTKSAQSFVTSTTLKAISNYFFTDSFSDKNMKNRMNCPHIDLANWANFILLAPATADLIARLALGFSNDLLSSICLSSMSPIAVAPSMNYQMYNSVATQQNLSILNNRKILIWGPEFGEQICGHVGYGRMLNTSILVRNLIQYFSKKKKSKHISIVLTAGPTREIIDPIRFLSNYSSGKMGFSIAKVAAEKGADVTLITGPVSLSTPCMVNRINVVSAIDMKNAVIEIVKNKDIFIGCAAVEDYRPVFVSDKKIKRDKESLTITLVKNPDIIKIVGKMQENRPYVVGFSAETHNLEKNAKKKRIDKNIDLICANKVSYDREGFNTDSNELYLFWKNGNTFFKKDHKLILAEKLFNTIINCYEENRN